MSETIYDKVIKMLDFIPDETGLKPTDMLKEHRLPFSPYGEKYCKDAEIPFLPCFIDIDSYVKIEGNKKIYRIQGYVLMHLTEWRNYTNEQMDFLILLAKEYSEWKLSDKGTIQMNIWNYRKEIITT